MSGGSHRLAVRSTQTECARPRSQKRASRQTAMNIPAVVITGELDQNAGGVLSASEKSMLVAVLGTTPADTGKRAQVLRAVAEDADTKARETNRAFVLMQYFGYLQRDPNVTPDTNYVGYKFWLDKLNSFNGDFRAAEMVKSFLVSGEYRGRFGP